MKIIVGIACLLTFTSTVSNGATDYRCLNNCTRQGYMYQFCVQNCSYDSNPFQYVLPQQPKMLTPMDIFPSARERIDVDQQSLRTLQMQEDLEAVRAQNRAIQDESKKRQKLLDLQIKEAEAQAAEREKKNTPWPLDLTPTPK